MNDQIVMTEILSLFSFLKIHVEINTKNSFNDVGLSLETFFMDLLNKIDGDNAWKNTNTITFNYPAIDLFNDRKKQAVQITTTANKKKITNTIEMYNKHDLKFESLIIIGFLNYTKFNQNNVISVGVEYIIQQIKGCSSYVKKEILNLIRESIPVQLLIPYNDTNCYQIVFNVLNRSAIRDDMYSEGSY
ncbi:MAG: SMEK domain-containing protein, partial [Mobilitalea sp.]